MSDSQELPVLEPLTSETMINLNELEYQNRILRLRAGLTMAAKCANSAIMGRPADVSEAVWMAAKLGEIHRFCEDALSNDSLELFENKKQE